MNMYMREVKAGLDKEATRGKDKDGSSNRTKEKKTAQVRN